MLPIAIVSEAEQVGRVLIKRFNNRTNQMTLRTIFQWILIQPMIKHIPILSFNPHYFKIQ